MTDHTKYLAEWKLLQIREWLFVYRVHNLKLMHNAIRHEVELGRLRPGRC